MSELVSVMYEWGTSHSSSVLTIMDSYGSSSRHIHWRKKAHTEILHTSWHVPWTIFCYLPFSLWINFSASLFSEIFTLKVWLFIFFDFCLDLDLVNRLTLDFRLGTNLATLECCAWKIPLVLTMENSVERHLALTYFLSARVQYRKQKLF